MDMSISREDFVRLLPVALGLSPYEEKDGLFTGRDGLRHWKLQLTPLADHRLGRMVLPRHRIEFSFEGYGEDEIAAFMARFQRGFQRGGG
jgi:hypothetical protein